MNGKMIPGNRERMLLDVGRKIEALQKLKKERLQESMVNVSLQKIKLDLGKVDDALIRTNELLTEAERQFKIVLDNTQ